MSPDDYSVAKEVDPKKQPSHQRDDKNTKSKGLNTNDLLCWAFQVSRGMKFLASRKVYLI